ncbi:MAG: zinc ribbon domain-containing protein, partial [Clostridia bacterium]|nr:zinc ribbon domain-containing protein [Clostridia bacterium]
MFCTNCGGQVPDNSKFCVCCGVKIENEQTGVVPKRVISDKHYSLEEIAEQQRKLNSSEINQSVGVNLKKTPSTDNLQNLIHNEQSPFKPMPEIQKDSSTENSTLPLPTDNQPYKMKSAGFPDEQEPVKRPPISEPIVPNNNFSEDTNNSNNSLPTQNNVPNNNFS